MNATRTSGTGLERDRNTNRIRCEQGLSVTCSYTLGRVHATGLKPERFRNRSSCRCSDLFHCVHSFRNEPTTSRCDRSGTVPEPFRLALWCERSTGPVPERGQSARSLRVGETGYGCHTFYITDVFRNIVIIAEIRPLLCLNIVSCAHINMQFVIFTS